MKTVKIIPSKSDAHRAYISAALAHIQKENKENADSYSSESIRPNSADSAVFDYLICDETSEDIEATKRCLIALLAAMGSEDTVADLYCGESGSTLRFLLPIVGALGKHAVFHPEGRLMDRPLMPLVDELCRHGMRIKYQDADDKHQEGNNNSNTVIVAEGGLTFGKYTLPGNISSQFISGLLFALPILEGDSEIIVEGILESSPYVDMTVDTLRRFGISIEDETLIELYGNNISQDEESGKPQPCHKIQRVFYVKGNQNYIPPTEYIVQGDWSNAAFWFAIGAIGTEAVRVEGLSVGTFQGDERIWDAIDVFGIAYSFGKNYVEVRPSRETMQGITWDASETPDMVPVLALLGAMSEGETRIINASRLRLKESDRLHTVSETLKAIGVEVDELTDGLIVRGCEKLSPATLNSYGDHRIAMMIAAASLGLSGSEKIELSGWEAVKKSYPSFFETLSALGFDKNLDLV